MQNQDVYGQMRILARKRTGSLSQPAELRGVPDSGQIVKLFVGQGHGIIRLESGREIYFHRADIQNGGSINDFAIGDLVAFERLDDRISGSRALAIVKQRPRRR